MVYVFEHSSSLGISGAQSGRGGGVARGERADVPALDAGYEEEGEAGLCGPQARQGVGQAGSDDRAEEVERLYRERYQGFTVKHFHEHLIKDHGFGWGYTWMKPHLQWAGVVGRRRARGRTAGSASGVRCRG